VKAFIISQPKAGTYLCSNLLINLGMTATGMHVKGNKYRTYNPTQPLPRFETKQQLREYIASVTTHAKSFNDILTRIPENGFAVGHLVPDMKYINGLKDFKKILLVRDFAEHQESIVRFQNEVKGSTSVDKNAYAAIANWQYESNVFVLDFNDMIKPRYAKIRKLQNFLFGTVITDEKEAMDKALASPSPTKSSIR